MLEFCPRCQNTVSLRMENGTVVQLCAVCNQTTDLPRGVFVMWESVEDDAIDAMAQRVARSHIHDDPTIPSISGKCPGCGFEGDIKFCKTGRGVNYTYSCPECRHVWWSKDAGEK